MEEWNAQLIKKGVYYEGWVDDVEQVIEDHKKATVTSYGTRRSTGTTKDTENCCPNESVKKVC